MALFEDSGHLLYIQVSDTCNVGCNFCMYKGMRQGQDLQVNKAVGERLLPLIRKAERVCLSGQGETLLNTNAVFSILNLSEGGCFDILTSAQLPNRDMADTVDRIESIAQKQGHTCSIRVSIDRFHVGGNLDENIRTLMRRVIGNGEGVRLFFRSILPDVEFATEYLSNIAHSIGEDISWESKHPLTHRASVAGTEFILEFQTVVFPERCGIQASPHLETYVDLLSSRVGKDFMLGHLRSDGKRSLDVTIDPDGAVHFYGLEHHNIGNIRQRLVSYAEIAEKIELDPLCYSFISQPFTRVLAKLRTDTALGQAVDEINSPHWLARELHRLYPKKLRKSLLKTPNGVNKLNLTTNSFFIVSNGCIRRKLDTQRVNDYLEANNYRRTKYAWEADHIIFVTCAFDQCSESVSLKIIERLQAQRSLCATLTLGGCLPSIIKNDIATIAKGARFFSPQDLTSIEKIFPPVRKRFFELDSSPVIDSALLDESDLGLREIFSKARKAYRANTETTTGPANKVDGEYHLFKNQSAIIYVARGCRSMCSYCGIRFAMGKLRSKPLESLVDSVRRHQDKGIQKITITGEDVGCYGLDRGIDVISMFKALLEVSCHTSFSVTGLNPTWIVDKAVDLASVMGEFPSLPHVVIPMQSASNDLLSRMNRNYTVSQVRSLLSLVSRRAPSTQIHTHVIVGFPGETKDDVEAMADFMREFRHVNFKLFSYADRPGTASTQLKPKVPSEEVANRLEFLAGLGQEKSKV